MNDWYTRYQRHRLKTELGEINKLIDGAALKTGDAQLIANYERLVSVVKQFSSFVEGLDPNLTTTAYLNTLAEPLPILRANLVSFLSTANASNLQAANNQADALTQHFPRLPIGTTVAALTTAASDFTKQTSNLLLTLQEQSKQQSEKVQQIVAAAASVAQKLTLQEKVIEDQKGRLDKAIADFQRQFSEAEGSRRKQIEETERKHNEQFAAFRDDIGKAIKAFTDQKQNDVGAILEQFKEQAKKAIAELDARKKQAADLVQVTANITVTGDYEKLAGQEKIAADYWRRVAIGFMTALVVAAAIILGLSFKENQFEWKMVIFRYATALILAFPAAYAMNESGHHRKMEQKYRRMQLELSSIDPFLESLPKDKRDDLKKALADRMFAQAEPVEKKPAIGAEKVLALAEKAIEGLSKK